MSDYQIVREYIKRTEMFDRTICRFSRNGVAIPVTPDEQKSCEKNARKVQRELGIHKVQGWRRLVQQFESDVLQEIGRFEGINERCRL